MKSWRYQPVYRDHENDDRTYSLCECYFDEENRLTAWTVNPEMTPVGTDELNDLIGTLERMLAAARRWEPVLFDDLKVGMTFREAGEQTDKKNAAPE